MTDSIVFLDRDTTDREDIDFKNLEAIGEVAYFGKTAPEEVSDRIRSANFVLTNKVVLGADEMDAAESLRLIQVVATGVNNIDLEAAKERNLAVCNVSGYSTESVAQHVFASLLNLVTNVDRFAAEPKKWAESPIFTRLDYPVEELQGQTMGIVGLGSIGEAVARIASAFGMNVVAYQREGAPSRGSIPRLSPGEFFATSDVISLHCPLTEKTRHLICEETLSLMKPTAILINTGRGDLVAEQDLVKALKQGTIRAAAVDVLTPEPPPADHLFLAADLPNLFITPHTAWSAREARQRLIDEIVSNLIAFREGNSRNRIV